MQLLLRRIKTNESGWSLCCVCNYLINSQGSLVFHEGLNYSPDHSCFYPEELILLPVVKNSDGSTLSLLCSGMS